MFKYRLNSDGASYTVIEITDLSVTRVVIPDTYNGLPITAVSADFFNCENLQEFVLGNNIIDTGYGTFDFPSIERIYLGKSVKTFLGPLALAEKLKDIYYGGTEDDWKKINFVFSDDSINILEAAKNILVFWVKHVCFLLAKKNFFHILIGIVLKGNREQ